MIGTALDVWEIVAACRSFGSLQERADRTDLTEPQIRLALAYHAERADEVDASIADNERSLEALRREFPAIDTVSVGGGHHAGCLLIVGIGHGGLGLILRVIDAALAGRPDSAAWRDYATAIAIAIAEGYRRMPQGTPDEWGDLSEAAEHANRETMRRLDAEERAAGFDPW